MEYKSESCKKLRRKEKINLLETLIQTSSESSLSESSDPDSLGPIRMVSRKAQVQETEHHQAKSDYVSRLFEKQKLKEKSLSKKIKTPFDRKLYRTCWPVEMGRVCKIKKKPKEKKKKKPNSRSLKKKKFSNPRFTSKRRRSKRESISDTESIPVQILDEESFDEILRNLNMNHFLYQPVSPQMLMDVLKDPEHLESGATLDMIISKLRLLQSKYHILNKDSLNPI